MKRVAPATEILENKKRRVLDMDQVESEEIPDNVVNEDRTEESEAARSKFYSSGLFIKSALVPLTSLKPGVQSRYYLLKY